MSNNSLFGSWRLNFRICLVIVSCILIISPAFAADPSAEVSMKAELSLEDIINNLKANQAKIKDMYAETETTITSNMSMPGQENKGPQKMVQKAKMWTKGQDKSKIEMISPMKQTTIANGDQMAIISSDTGQKTVQDLKKLREKTGGLGSGSQMGLDKAKEFFDLSVKRLDTSAEAYVITGVPKKENKFLGRMEFYVDSNKWVPTKILMYDAKGKLMSQSVIEYEKIVGAFVPVKNVSNVTTPMGRMDIEMEYENVEVNRGINDKEFKIE